MTVENIEKVGIIGAGTMGQGIAQITALSGFDTLLYDLDKERLDHGMQMIRKNMDKGIEKGKITEEAKNEALAKIHLTDRMEEVKADLVIEAVLEQLDTKIEVFTRLEEINDPATVLATNTSSIPITRIASALQYPARFIGMHFFNPAHIMKLVEVISGAATDPSVADLITNFALKLGKTPVSAHDAPGFIVNRVARHFYVESLKIVEENVADFETVDKLIEATGFRMGPFRLMDLIGVDTNFSVTTSMYHAFHQEPKFRPSRVQQQKVDAGHWGRKTGRGFYKYDD